MIEESSSGLAANAPRKLLPSQVQQVSLICRHELRKFLRSKRVIGVMVLAVLASAALANLTIGFFRPPDVTTLLGLSILLAPILLIITAALVGSDALLTEFHEKTGYSLFPNPISRIAIWFGKFLAAEIIIFIVIGIYFGALSLTALASYGDLPAGFLLAPLLFSLVLGTMVMSIAFLGSAVFRGPLGATITVLFGLSVLPIIDMVLASNNIMPWFMPYTAANNVYLSMAYLQGDLLIGSEIINPLPIVGSAMVIVAYVVGFSAASIYLFKRRDM